MTCEHLTLYKNTLINSRLVWDKTELKTAYIPHVSKGDRISVDRHHCQDVNPRPHMRMGDEYLCGTHPLYLATMLEMLAIINSFYPIDLESSWKKSRNGDSLIILLASLPGQTMFWHMYFLNSLIMYEVSYQPQDLYHITCMCLDTQWKRAYHSPVKINMH